MRPDALEGGSMTPLERRKLLVFCLLPAPLGAGNLKQGRQCARQCDESKLHWDLPVLVG